jgi:hyperpolarization activated cyclic nucleotide-gated potassium channel 2
LIASFPFEAIFLFLDDDPDGNVGSNASRLGRVGKVFKLLRVVKLLRVLKLGRILTRFRRSTQCSPNLILLAKTIAVMLMTWHWSACVYWWVASQEIDREVGGENWLPPRIIQPGASDELGAPYDASFSDQYAYAWFWAVSVTTSGGYEIFPMTQVEVLYSSFITILGTAL